MDARIILVHGLAAKPPPRRLHELWKRSLLANVAADTPDLAARLEDPSDLFRSAYWANAVPDHLENTTAAVNRVEQAVERLIAVRRRVGIDLHISRAGWAKAKIKRFGLGIVDSLATALSVKNDVIDAHMREVHLYHEDQYVADRIRAPLERELREAWDQDKTVVVLAHSMGTFIAYDVLWRFSHRSEAEYRRYRKREVALLVTMGSPLGDAGLREFMLIDRWKTATRARTRTERRRYYPTNIRRWHNYSAYGDVVCHDGRLADDFFEGLCRHVGGYGKDDLRDYIRLYNPFVDPDGKANPHKSFGYLIQPKLSQKLRQFFASE